jgi:uncharacterized protein (TIGR03067 family)
MTVKVGDEGEDKVLNLDFVFLGNGKGWIQGLDKDRKRAAGFTYALDDGKEPRRIALKHDEENSSEHGIYSIEGDTLRMAFDGNERSPPLSFSEKDVTSYVFRRAPAVPRESF